jgi:hypothetical protein
MDDWDCNALEIRKKIQESGEDRYISDLISMHCPNTEVDSISSFRTPPVLAGT